jgi:hypothetical protein
MAMADDYLEAVYSRERLCRLAEKREHKVS